MIISLIISPVKQKKSLRTLAKQLLTRYLGGSFSGAGEGLGLRQLAQAGQNQLADRRGSRLGHPLGAAPHLHGDPTQQVGMHAIRLHD